MYCIEFIEKMIRGLTRLNRSKSLISESEDQRALGSIRKETLFRAVSDPTQWICLKSQPEKKQTQTLLPYGLELSKREVFWGKKWLKLMQEGRGFCFSVLPLIFTQFSDTITLSETPK